MAAKKYKVIVDNVSLYLSAGEERCTVSMCTARPEIKDQLRYDEIYEQDESISVHYNGLVSNAPSVEIGKTITVTVG